MSKIGIPHEHGSPRFRIPNNPPLNGEVIETEQSQQGRTKISTIDC